MNLTFTKVAPSRAHPTAKLALLEKHYLHRLPPISHMFLVVHTEEHGGPEIVGVLTFGTPPSRHLQQSACPANPHRVLELNRLWLDDRLPANTASAFIAHALSRLPPAIVVSYADTAAGHAGYVYRAANFFYAGWTDMERKTPRFDYVPDNGKHSRDAFRSGAFTRVRRKPKVKYWTVTGNRREKHELSKLAGWPKLSWKTNPPPVV